MDSLVVTAETFIYFFLPWWASGGSEVKASACVCLQCGRPGFDSWVRKIPRRKWQPTPVFLPGESHGQRSLVGCSPWGYKESDTIEWLHFTSLSKITCQNFNGLSESMGLEVEYRPFGLTDSCLALGMAESPLLQWRMWSNRTPPFARHIYCCCSACALLFVKCFACGDLEEFERHLWPLQVAFQEHLCHRLLLVLTRLRVLAEPTVYCKPKQKK